MKKSKELREPVLLSRAFWNGWYTLVNLSTGDVMRGMTHRVKGGFFLPVIHVSFRSGTVIGNPKNMPSLDQGVVFVSKTAEKSVKNGVARISWSTSDKRGSSSQKKWRLTLHRESHCPPWMDPDNPTLPNWEKPERRRL